MSSGSRRPGLIKLSIKVTKATLLAGGLVLDVTLDGDGWKAALPANMPNGNATVIRLE
jgi:hypothetical protein